MGIIVTENRPMAPFIGTLDQAEPTVKVWLGLVKGFLRGIFGSLSETFTAWIYGNLQLMISIYQILIYVHY